MIVTIIWKRNVAPTVQSILDPSEALKYVAGLLEHHADDIKDWSIAGTTPADLRLANVDVTRDGQNFSVKLFDRNDRPAAVINTDAVRLQEFALRVLNQTTYSFADAVDK